VNGTLFEDEKGTGVGVRGIEERCRSRSGNLLQNGRGTIACFLAERFSKKKRRSEKAFTDASGGRGRGSTLETSHDFKKPERGEAAENALNKANRRDDRPKKRGVHRRPTCGGKGRSRMRIVYTQNSKVSS